MWAKGWQQTVEKGKRQEPVFVPLFTNVPPLIQETPSALNEQQLLSKGPSFTRCTFDSQDARLRVMYVFLTYLRIKKKPLGHVR